MTRPGLLIVVLAGLAACSPHERPGAAPAFPALSERHATVESYQRQTTAHPQQYPMHAQLGAAYLARARLTHDPADVAAARAALLRSLELQANFTAYKTMAAVCNFSHRFEEAIKWGTEAARALPQDSSVRAQLVESHLGLGQIDQAAGLLPQATEAPGDFYTATALGRWFEARSRVDEAVAAFVAAAQFARAQEVNELVVWANVSAAGVLLDCGRSAEARPYIEQAAQLDPRDIRMRVHQAEWLEANARPAEALRVYEDVLADVPEPSTHAQACALARSLGSNDVADRHFRAAEASFRSAIDAGEGYTLGDLAALYLDAGVHLAEARELAQQNLRYQGTQQARALGERARAMSCG